MITLSKIIIQISGGGGFRTPGSQTQYGATVNVNGGVVNIGYHVDDSYVGIRPAMWIYY